MTLKHRQGHRQSHQVARPSPFQQSLAGFRVARFPSNSWWASCFHGDRPRDLGECMAKKKHLQ